MDGAYVIGIPFVQKNKQEMKCEKCKILSSFFYVSVIDGKIVCPRCFLKENEYEEHKASKNLNRMAILRGDNGFSGKIYQKPKKDFKIII